MARRFARRFSQRALLATLLALGGTDPLAHAAPPKPFPSPKDPIITPGDPLPPPPPLPPKITVSVLISRGYTCEPEGLGKRCTRTARDPAWAEYRAQMLWICGIDQTCSLRARKELRDEVDASRFRLWAYEFAPTAKKRALGDFNGDGKADLLAFLGGASDPRRGDAQVALSLGSKRFGPAQLWSKAFCYADSTVCAVGQVGPTAGGQISNGPPPPLRDDILAFVRSSGNVYVSSSTGLAFAVPARWNTALSRLGAEFLVADFDGNGLDDVAVIVRNATSTDAAGTVRVAENRQPLFPGSVASFGNAGEPGETWIAGFCPDPGRCLTGDMNGDGRADLVRVRRDGRVVVALSDGASFQLDIGEANYDPTWSETFGNEGVAYHVADMNADRLDDLVAIRADGGLVIGLSNGRAIVAAVDVGESSCGNPSACRLGDVNGDGLPDLVELVTAPGTGPTIERPGDVWVSLFPGLFPEPPEPPSSVDGDGDGIPDRADNCIQVRNATQSDADRDGVGDPCDGDLDGNGVVNAADLALLKADLFRSGAGLASDLNGDGVVNVADLTILKSRLFRTPGPSSTTVPPRIDLFSLRHGTFYAPDTAEVWVAGFVPNVRPEDLELKVAGQTLGITKQGYFTTFVPVREGDVFNPIRVDATRRSTEAKKVERVVAIVAESAPLGELAPASLAVRVEAWTLDDLAYMAANAIDTDAVALKLALASNKIDNVHLWGPIIADVVPSQGQLEIHAAIVNGFTAEFKVAIGFLPICWFDASVNPVRFTLKYDVRPAPNDPGRLILVELEGSPKVSVEVEPHGVCGGGADALKDIEGAIEAAFESDLRARYHLTEAGALIADGPADGGTVAGPIENALNSIDPSALLEEYGIELRTLKRDVREDILGLTLEADATALPTCRAPDDARVLRTGAQVPEFPIWTPAHEIYDLGVALAPDALNSLLDAATRTGLLADQLAQTPLDPAALTQLGTAQLDPKIRLRPTLAPVLTGRVLANEPSVTSGGVPAQSAEVLIGQLLFEADSLFKPGEMLQLALDLRARVYLAPGSCALEARLHHFELVGSDAFHIPAPLTENDAVFLTNQISAALADMEFGLSLPLPAVSGLRVKPIAAALEEGSVFQVFALLVSDQGQCGLQQDEMDWGHEDPPPATQQMCRY